jgi:hypothetical protein
MDRPLSNFDIMNITDNMANLELYCNLHSYDSLDDLLGPYGACFLLFETKPNFGHWVLIHKLPNNHVEFFNSYGGFSGDGGYPDDCLDFIPKKYRKKSNQDYPYLSKLLLDSGYDLDFNEYKLQSKNNNIATCGRWCIVRYFLSYIPLKKFAKMFKKGDPIVTVLTEWINN